MATNFNELSGLKQWAAVRLGQGQTVALYYVVFKNQTQERSSRACCAGQGSGE